MQIRTGIVDIREAGRATQGVKLIRIDEGDEIAAISQIEEDDEEIVTETTPDNESINQEPTTGEEQTPDTEGTSTNENQE